MNTRAFLMQLLCLGGMLAVTCPVYADDSEAVLVLDASGSMWGKVNGRHKIDIAREVVGKVLDSVPAERKLGLFAYGHNRKGDCKDIEQLAPAGTSRKIIRDAIRQLNPKGRTPLSAAVMAAAQSLRYTEDKATVILISDGVETCGADPCAVGRQLEKDGLDFTAHVIGFDLSEKAASQLSCLAHNTGGKFIAAADASQLADALQVTVVKPVAKLTRLVLSATEMKNGPLAKGELQWVVRQSGTNGAIVFESLGTNQVSTGLPAGTYDITVVRTDDNAHGERRLVRIADNRGKQKVQVSLEVKFEASLEPEPSSEIMAGKPLMVHWTGPDRKDDYIVIARAQDRSGRSSHSTKTRAGNPLTVRAPLQPGHYEVRYVLRHPPKDLAVVPITVTAARAKLTAPESVGVGQEFSVGWDGPDTKGDRIHLARAQDPDAATTTLKLTRQGNPLNLRAPLQPGSYELRYLLGGRQVIARIPLTITKLSATLVAPDRVVAGSRLAVEWAGPDGQQDFLVIARAGDEPTRRVRSVAVRLGNPGALKAPLVPGEYELRYLLNNKKVLANRPLQVTAATALLSGPSSAAAGSAIVVKWDGPDGSADMITVARPDALPHRRASMTRTRKGSPGSLRMPVEPGPYELRYVQDNKIILARQPISVVAVEASVSGPDSVATGEKFLIEWAGPGGSSDLITLAVPGQEPHRRLATGLVRRGSPLTLSAPVNPGTYELRYVQAGRKVIARQTIQVEQSSATVTAPETVMAGSDVMVEWTGPENSNDLIFLARPEQAANRRIATVQVRRGSPGRLSAPLATGEYELRYALNGRKIIARTSLQVTEAIASVSGPAQVLAGGQFVVEWSGPSADGDRIALARPQDIPRRQQASASTRQGSPLRLTAPLLPGKYEIRYVQRGKKTVASSPIDVKAVTAKLSVPSGIQIGQPVGIDWEGPAQRGDIIGLFDASGSAKRLRTVRLPADGGPVVMRMPFRAGGYELRYLQRGKVALTAVTIRVEAAEASISGPREAIAESPFGVRWDGPDFPGDLIAIARADDPPNRYRRVQSTRSGPTMVFIAPPTAGDYEIRYLLNGRQVLAAQPLTIQTGQ